MICPVVPSVRCLTVCPTRRSLGESSIASDFGRSDRALRTLRRARLGLRSGSLRVRARAAGRGPRPCCACVRARHPALCGRCAPPLVAHGRRDRLLARLARERRVRSASKISRSSPSLVAIELGRAAERRRAPLARATTLAVRSRDRGPASARAPWLARSPPPAGRSVARPRARSTAPARPNEAERSGAICSKSKPTEAFSKRSFCVASSFSRS